MPEPERSPLIPSAAVPAEPFPVASNGTAGPTSAPPKQYRWYHKIAGVAAAIFCFELGVFLLLFPWSSTWDVTYGVFLPVWARPYWANPYLRGAVSGVGLLNIYISLSELFRLRRFSG